MARYTEKDAAKDTDTSIREVNRAWHDARDHAQALGELDERAINKASKESSSETPPDNVFDIDSTSAKDENINWKNITDNDIKNVINNMDRENAGDTSIDENSELDLTQELLKNQEIADSTNELQPNEAQKKFQEFVDNGEEIMESFENKSGSSSEVEEQYQEFEDNERDIIKDYADANSSSDLFQEFEENRLDFTEPNSTEEKYEEFSENTNDITGQTETQSENEESNYDLKP